MSAQSATSLRFTKMHGLGNDFVIVDCRAKPLPFEPAQIVRMGDRHCGVGFDQLLTIEPARDSRGAFRYSIFNSDGSVSGQCGNGVRCVAAWLKRAGVLGTGASCLESPSGLVTIELLDDNRVRVDMDTPRFAPADVPFVVPDEADIYFIDVDGARIALGAVSIGNPHALIEVADLAAAPVAILGPQIASHKQFPQGCNVGFAQIVDRSRVRLRVWERGAGATLACGTGACAAVAVLRRRGKLDAVVHVEQLGGMLEVSWQGGMQPVWMTGPAEFVFDGEWLA